MSMTTVANPGTRSDRPATATTSTQTNQTMAVNPYPCDDNPSIWATFRSAQSAALDAPLSVGVCEALSGSVRRFGRSGTGA
jgi:hypothetical protein